MASRVSFLNLECFVGRHGGLKMTKTGLLGIQVLRCTADGNFDKVQCYGSLGVCWCVDPITGHRRGTSVRGDPKC